MADKILVSSAAMLTCISKYQDAQGQMMDAQQQMSKAMHHLDNCWKGPGWAAMMAKWAEIEGNIARSQLAINRTIVGLKNAEQNYDATEEHIISLSNSLEVGRASTVYPVG